MLMMGMRGWRARVHARLYQLCSANASPSVGSTMSGIGGAVGRTVLQ